VTINNSPSQSNTNTNTSLHQNANEGSKITSKHQRDSDFGTRDQIYEKLRNVNHNTNGSNQDTVKKMYPNADQDSSFDKPKNRLKEINNNRERLNCSTEAHRETKNKLSLVTSTKSSPFKFYHGTNHRSSKNLSTANSNSQNRQNRDKPHSFILQGSTNLGIKKENQIYAKSLEEFIESNIKCINDLIQYKHIINNEVLKYNAKNKNTKVQFDFQSKRQSQLKLEINNLLSVNNAIK